MAGRVEEWRKYGLEEPLGATDWQWSLVDKVVLTRTFAPDDSGSVLEMEHGALQPSGCDIELATVTVGPVVAWTFALEAWGDGSNRRDLIDSSLAGLLDQLPPPPSQFVAGLEVDMGYPEWLAATVWADGVVASQ